MTDRTNHDLFERARRVIPGGVNSPVRAFGSVGGEPYFVSHAEGPHLWDVEGRRYIDLVQSYGAILLGHANPGVVDAVCVAAADGTSFGAPTPGEVRLAELICERVPSVDQVRLVSSGTEATMSAIRTARGFTGRPRLVKFAGNYHGHSDALLVAGGTAMASLGLPGSAGVPPSAVADTIVAPYNVVPTLDEQTAAVIVEPIAANMGLVPPVAGFLEGLRTECDRVGALLIFDEVITGFRVAAGGAQDLLGVTPDLTTFGKVIGGGLPVGAFGGRGEIMEVLAPLGPVYQAGTLSGNPLATAAGCCALDQLTDATYAALARSGGPVCRGPAPGHGGGRAGGSGSGGGHAGGTLLRRGAGRGLRLGAAHGRGALRRLLPPDAGPRGGVGAGRLRGDVPGHHPSRRRARPGGRSGRRGGQGRRRRHLSPPPT